MTDQAVSLWAKARGKLAETLNEGAFTAWIAPATPISFEDNVFVLEVSSRFFRDYIANHHLDEIRGALADAAGLETGQLSLELRVAAEPSAQPVQQVAQEPREQPRRDAPHTRSLNVRYVFSRFVVGASNKQAYARAVAVAKAPAKEYNPLFIYGGVGLGKTHLMHAIGHEIARQQPAAKICFITGEKFTNELIDAIQNRRMSRFRSIYRRVDVLLIDDVHFLAGKESTQEEFFHTFNDLYDNHRQIVLTSDRGPKEIPGLEERLVSRFEWGVVDDVGPPDLELRMAILGHRAAERAIELPQDVRGYVARNIKYNIRELEGALNRIVAFAKVEGRPITVELAQEALRTILPAERGKQITIDLIQRKVAEHFQLRALDLKMKKRTKSVVLPRQVAMFLSRELTDRSLPEIGDYFGGRDHSTVIHACRRVTDRIAADEALRETVERLAEAIRE